MTPNQPDSSLSNREPATVTYETHRRLLDAVRTESAALDVERQYTFDVSCRHCRDQTLHHPATSPTTWHHHPDAPREHFCEECDYVVRQLGVAILRAERAEAALAPTMPEEEPCSHPRCGLPDRLHGAPDRSRPTHSSHWYRAALSPATEAPTLAVTPDLDVETLARAWDQTMTRDGAGTFVRMADWREVAATYRRLRSEPIAKTGEGE